VNRVKCEVTQKDRKLQRWVIVIMLLIGAGVLGLELVRAIVVYDDWRCAFGNCRITVTVK